MVDLHAVALGNDGKHSILYIYQWWANYGPKRHFVRPSGKPRVYKQYILLGPAGTNFTRGYEDRSQSPNFWSPRHNLYSWFV